MLKQSLDTDTTENEQGFPENAQEYAEIEALVLEYKKQFEANTDKEQAIKSQYAADELICRFTPLMRKYLHSIQDGYINYEDKDIKRFVLCFLGDKTLKRALKADKQSNKIKHEIHSRFNFVSKTYGQLTAEEILIDLQMLLLVLAKRYKVMGRNFCAYLYNTYCYEVSRHIKKFIKNPSNIAYKNCKYEDYLHTYTDVAVENSFEDKIYEDSMGIPDLTWLSGLNCSELFQQLSTMERKILIKYYLEDYNDRQIANEFSIHINTCNQKRRNAINKLANFLDIDPTDIKRSRKSGKKAIFF